tara:strand:- start:1995 stop:2954 length:960 start_codon:yes stop_codon:yes gene_type:complete
MKAKTAIITGISGQDAYFLSAILRSHGYSVIGLTRNKTNYVSEIEGVDIVETDYSTESLESLLTSEVSIIFHLAGQSWVSKSWEFLDDTISSQALITAKFLDLLSQRKSLGIKFIQASSSEIFYSDEKNAITEDSIIAPVNPYGCAKAFAFHLVNMYRDKYELDASNAILFPHESSRRPKQFAVRKVVSGLYDIFQDKIDQILLGRIDVTRDWGYAPEFSQALFKIGESSRASNYCICTSHAMTLRTIVDICLDYWGLDFHSCIKLDSQLVRYFDYSYIKGDNSKIREEIGWSPVLIGEKLVRQLIEDEIRTRKRGDLA